MARPVSEIAARPNGGAYAIWPEFTDIGKAFALAGPVALLDRCAPGFEILT